MQECNNLFDLDQTYFHYSCIGAIEQALFDTDSYIHTEFGYNG